MTDTNNEWIDTAREELQSNNKDFIIDHEFIHERFKQSIEDNLPEHYKMLDQIRWGIELNEKFKYEVIPKSISREAVEKLREKCVKIKQSAISNWWEAVLDIVIKDLDILLSKDKDG